MTTEKYILLGRITRVHGFKGAVTVKLEKQFFEKLPEMETVFLEIEGKPVPFFIEYNEQAGRGFARMKFEGYNSVLEVRELTGCPILAKGISAHKSNNDPHLNELIGYEVFSGEESIGEINNIIENPGQLLLEVDNGRGGRILIPFHEDLIIQINALNKNVIMDLPDGLTEIN